MARDDARALREPPIEELVFSPREREQGHRVIETYTTLVSEEGFADLHVLAARCASPSGAPYSRAVLALIFPRGVSCIRLRTRRAEEVGAALERACAWLG